MRLRSFVLVASVSGMTLLSGCGLFGSSSSHHSQTPSSTPATGSTSSTSSSTPPSSSTPSSSSASSTPSSTSASVSVSSSTTTPTTVQAPSPPGAGNYMELHVAVPSVTREGTATSSGKTLNLYLVKFSVTNPTSSLIQLTLNDMTVVPSGQAYHYSWNDYASSGLSSSTSLFPYPLTPTHPNSTVLDVFPGQTKKGTVTVQVPPSSQYQVRWGDSGSSAVVATFTP